MTPLDVEQAAATVFPADGPCAVVVVPGMGMGLATEAGCFTIRAAPDLLQAAPARLVWWRPSTTTRELVAHGVRPGSSSTSPSCAGGDVRGPDAKAPDMKG